MNVLTKTLTNSCGNRSLACLNLPAFDMLPTTGSTPVVSAAESSAGAQFRELRSLGRGAQGEVVLVEHVGTGERYALKRLELSPCTSSASSAVTEVEVLCKLQHPNCTRLYGAWRASSRLHILMEYADGGSLADRVAAQRSSGGCPFDEERILDWTVQIVSALAYMHSLSVLHRDLKTGNIFLTARNLVKVGDFGISKVLEGEGTARLAKTAVGTPYYLAPELVNGEHYGLQVDVWALGVVLYELMTLRRPFEADNLPALALRILKVQYPPPAPSLPYSAELRALLASLLQRDPARRPTLAQLAAAPLLRRQHAKLHAELRTLSLAAAPLPPPPPPPAARAPAASPNGTTGATVGATVGAAVGATVGATAAEGRAVACAMRMQRMLDEMLAANEPLPPAGGRGDAEAAAAGDATAMLGTTSAGVWRDEALGAEAAPAASDAAASSPGGSLAEHLRFSRNLQALELNLAAMEVAGEELPVRRDEQHHLLNSPSLAFSPAAGLPPSPAAAPFSPLAEADRNRPPSSGRGLKTPPLTSPPTAVGGTAAGAAAGLSPSVSMRAARLLRSKFE
jgi:hypothetical protein